MRMRDLEKASGVGRETIRFYIREGLLPEPARASRNSASYGEEHVARLKAIKRLQEERFLPLAVIRTLLDDDSGERWLEPQAFPMLDALLAARLGGEGERIGLAALRQRIGGEDDEIAEHVASGLISVDVAATLSARDAAILTALAELRDIGFTRDLGFTAEAMRFYTDFIEWVTNQEMRLFFEHTTGQVGEGQALLMAERGIAVINDLLSLLRTRAILRKLGERRRVANDNA